jgi:hypothetical protein
VNWLVSTVGLLSSLLLLRHLRGLKSRQLDALLMAFHLNFFGVSFRAHLRRGRLTEFTIFLIHQVLLILMDAREWLSKGSWSYTNRVRRANLTGMFTRWRGYKKLAVTITRNGIAYGSLIACFLGLAMGG